LTCPQCLHENPSTARFCGRCGIRLSDHCASCGSEINPAAKFCAQCGHAVTGPVPRLPSPDAYVPKHLVDKILTSKGAMEGERKQVTVLFADLKGSMELLAERDPEEARKILDPVLERLMDAVHRYEGTVNQVMGDGIMALFGAPLAHEDHTARACYAALLMQESVERYASDVHALGEGALKIRVGLNAGEVVVRSIGNDLRMDYTAVGQTTHLAARMEQMAPPGSILIPADALRLAEGYVEVKSLGRFTIKGLAHPIEVCEVIGAGRARTRFQVSAARGLTRFVGRDAEIDELHRTLKQARNGQGQVLAVVGEAGLGKSRLFHEFIHSPSTEGCLVLECGSVSYGKARSYLPIIDLLKVYFHIEDRDDQFTIREKVAGRLLTVGEALHSALPPFLALLDVPLEDPSWQALDPAQRRHRTLTAVQGLLLWESRVQPLLIVVENLHWIDSQTQGLLDSLVTSLPTTPILLLVNYRPDYQHGWASRTYYRQIRIDPLAPKSAEELLRALLGDDVTLQQLKRLLVERTEGNPFFLEESVRTLVETGVLAGERGGYRLAKDVTSIQVAPTVQAVLAARIDRLSAENKRLLQCAAVIGKDVPFTLLRAIADVHEDDLQAGLSDLQAAEFVYETSLFPDLEYTFKHALTHEVAYGSLLQNRRHALHARVVEAIEMLYPDRRAEQVERLAHHAVRAEMWEAAEAYLRQAGSKALARSANREAAAYLEQALRALERLPETPDTLRRAIDIRFDLRNAFLPMGKFDTFYRYLREAETLARKLGDQRRLGWTSVYLCHYFWMTGRASEARTLGHSAHGIADTLSDATLHIVASFYLGLACYASGDHPRAEELFRAAVRSLEGDLSRQRCGLAGFPAAMSRSYLGLAVANRGAFGEGIANAEEGIRVAEALDHPYSLIVACWSLGLLYDVKGDPDEAARVLERGLALCREWKLTVLVPLVSGPLGYAYALTGRVTEGLSLLSQALQDMEVMGRGAYHSQVVVHLGEACVLAGRLDEARTFAERALTLTRTRGERGDEASALCLLGDVAAQGHPLDVRRAEEHYHMAMALAEELTMRPLVARCHLGLGALHGREGTSSEVREHLTRAMTMFREMHMTFWLERADRELHALG
jgi:class 3 adenylate cyclase/tetratricopeptide (TPR) repeat protein